jgi:hypothetical protein
LSAARPQVKVSLPFHFGVKRIPIRRDLIEFMSLYAGGRCWRTFEHEDVLILGIRMPVLATVPRTSVTAGKDKRRRDAVNALAK